MIGETIHNYTITAKIGEGGMGTVYLADDTMLDRQVAIKVLHPRLVEDKMLMERFKNEAKTLARLNHPNIATLYSLLQHGTSLCMVLEYVDGTTLEDMLGKYGALPPGLVTNLACQVLDGLQYAHDKGIVHRDIKPANLMITRDGKVKVMDFGIARVMGSSRATRVGTAIGTLEYMSPEQIRSEEVTPKSDIYSLGIVLYEMLSGQVPFKGVSEFNLMQSQINQKPAPLRSSLPNISNALNTAVLKALEKDPDNRFSQAPDFKQALTSAVPGTMSLAEFEATRHAQPKETQILISVPNPRIPPKAAQPALGAKWWEKMMEDGNTAKKIFFIAVAVLVFLLLMELVCSRLTSKPEIVKKETITTIAGPVNQPQNTVPNATTTLPIEEPASEAVQEESTAASGYPSANPSGQPSRNNSSTQPDPKKSPKNQQTPGQKPNNESVTPIEPPKTEPIKPEPPKYDPPKPEPQTPPKAKRPPFVIGHNNFITIAPRSTVSSTRLSVGSILELEATAPFITKEGVTVIAKGATVKASVKEVNSNKNFTVEFLNVQTVNPDLAIGIYDPILKIKGTEWTKNEVKKIELQKTKNVVIPY